jgi:hypothetical protein
MNLEDKVNIEGKFEENGHKVTPYFLKTPLPTLCCYTDGKERQNMGI